MGHLHWCDSSVLEAPQARLQYPYFRLPLQWGSGTRPDASPDAADDQTKWVLERRQPRVAHSRLLAWQQCKTSDQSQVISGRTNRR